MTEHKRELVEDSERNPMHIAQRTRLIRGIQKAPSEKTVPCESHHLSNALALTVTFGFGCSNIFFRLL